MGAVYKARDRDGGFLAYESADGATLFQFSNQTSNLIMIENFQ